jgi:homoserine dehydrogenase
MRDHRFVIAGLGNVGRRLLELVLRQEDLLARRHGLRLRCVGASDSSGALADPAGLSLARLAEVKRRGGRLSELGPVAPPLELFERVETDVFLEATPTDLKTGGIALPLTRRALERGIDTVVASKGPLVLHFDALAALSDLRAEGLPGLRFSGAVGSALPTFNLGRRDLAGAEIEQLEGILNLTSQMLLGAMTAGQSYEEALAEARRLGTVEANPALDVGGWDAANKLVILANAVLGIPAQLEDVTVRGIEAVQPEQLAQARNGGTQVTLLASAVRDPGVSLGYRLSVTPTVLAPEHPLSRIGPKAKGITYLAPPFGEVTAISRSEDASGASAAMLRDVIELATR